MRSPIELEVDGRPVPLPATDRPASGLVWLDVERGEAVLELEGTRHALLIEGGGAEWVVVIRGRRVPVTVRSHRDRLLAEVDRSTAHRRRSDEVRATLPGLVVRVLVQVGDEVAEGDPLLTVEAMKMQNEVRATHPGRVEGVEVSPGESIATGALLIRLVEPDP